MPVHPGCDAPSTEVATRRARVAEVAYGTAGNSLPYGAISADRRYSRDVQMRKGVKLIEEEVGDGPPLQRKQFCLLAMRVTLNRGEIVREPRKFLAYQFGERFEQLGDGFFCHRLRFTREDLASGIFYALEGMNEGGFRKVTIAPHLAYGKNGVPDVIPPHAVLTVEIRVLKAVIDYESI